MSHTVDFKDVSTAGLESSPVAEALAGLRANEARYFKRKYDTDFTVESADERPRSGRPRRPRARAGARHRDRLAGARGGRGRGRRDPLDPRLLRVRAWRSTCSYTLAEGGKRAVGFKLSEGMDAPEELATFKWARQKSALAGTIRGSYFVIRGEY